MDNAGLMKRVKKAWAQKDQWVGLYDDAYSLAIPNRNTMYDQTPGQDKNITVYDSTLQQSTVKLASTLQSTITPPFTEWATMRPGPFISQDREEITRKLQLINKTVFAAISSSNFDTAIGEFWLDVCIGTGALLVLEAKGDDNLFKFIPVPISEIALEDGPDNTVGAVFRKYKKPVGVLHRMWSDMKMVPELEKMIREDQSKQIVIHELTHREDGESKWTYSVLLEKVTSNSEPVKIVERTYTTNPWIISRWLKVAGETFGRGPVLNALPDAKTLNAAKKMELQNASLAISGVWLARNNGVLNGNSIRIRPGAVIPVQSTGGSMGADLVPLQVGGDLNYSQLIAEDLRQAIKDAMFDRSIPDAGAVRSATEWIVRQQELQEAIGAPFGRMHQELIVPLYNRILDILYKKGVIDKLKIDGNNVKVQITGALAQAQNMKDVETIVNWAQTAITLTGPEVFQATAKVEDIVDKLGALMGIDANLIRTQQEREQVAQMAMAAAQGGLGGQGTNGGGQSGPA
jgi:hypothetical protein